VDSACRPASSAAQHCGAAACEGRQMHCWLFEQDVVRWHRMCR
jgi:hypothetical protein